MYLNYLHKQRQFELARMRNIFREDVYNSYALPLYENFFKESMLDKFNPYADYTWDDSSRIAGYIEYLTRRISKFGLHYGLINQNKFKDYKQTIQVEEDKIVDYLLYEMRKSPQEKEFSEFRL